MEISSTFDDPKSCELWWNRIAGPPWSRIVSILTVNLLFSFFFTSSFPLPPSLSLSFSLPLYSSFLVPCPLLCCILQPTAVLGIGLFQNVAGPVASFLDRTSRGGPGDRASKSSGLCERRFLDSARKYKIQRIEILLPRIFVERRRVCGRFWKFLRLQSRGTGRSEFFVARKLKILAGAT